MTKRPGTSIGTRAFLLAALVHLALMLAAGILTWILPAGVYERTLVDAREVMVSDSYREISLAFQALGMGIGYEPF